MIVIASDHGGFELKQAIGKWLKENRYDFIDCGTDSDASVDYPVYAKLAAQQILSGKCERGIICCGTGIGISIAANRFKGIRAANCESVCSAEMCRRHNDANILCLGGRTNTVECALEMVKVFLTTGFDGGERHERRIKLMDEQN